MELQEAYKVMQAASGIEVGDEVKVLRTNKTNELGSCVLFHTKSELDELGWSGVVTDIYSNSVKIKLPDNHSFIMPFFVLEVTKKHEPEPTMITVKGKEYSEDTLAAAMKQYVEG